MGGNANTLDIIMLILRYANLGVSIIGTIITGKLFILFWNQRKKQPNHRLDAYYVLLATFGLFLLYSIANTIVYMFAFTFEANAPEVRTTASFRTLVAGIGTILLAVYYSRLDSPKS